jgi:hypothetical protein
MCMEGREAEVVAGSSANGYIRPLTQVSPSLQLRNEGAPFFL